MQIMSQDERRLVNSEYVSQFYIEEAASGVKLIAETGTGIIRLGIYDNVKHAEKALHFIGFCMTHEDCQNKITQVPTQEDLNMGNGLFSKSNLKELLAKALSSATGKHDDSELDFETMLKDILK